MVNNIVKIGCDRVLRVLNTVCSNPNKNGSKIARLSDTSQHYNVMVLRSLSKAGLLNALEKKREILYTITEKGEIVRNNLTTAYNNYDFSFEKGVLK